MTGSRFEKGVFSADRLPVSERYVPTHRRRRLFLVGVVLAAVLAAGFVADALIGRATTIAPGPVSASHALFAADCSSCHVPLEGVPDATCQGCHAGDGGAVGVYGFQRHYLYRSGDVDRSAPVALEASCGSCHREHGGRDASLLDVADARCIACHDTGTFSDDHPEFEFARRGLSDPANLEFPHARHVREVMDEGGLVDVEAACLRCHVPEPDGRSFQPISFARHCDACHLSPSTSTPVLPRRRAAGGAPGVRSLEEIRGQGEPGSTWASYWNPNEFRETGGGIQKRPVYHADPWILHNLRDLRRDLYPGAELADLLRTTPDVPPDGVRALYDEAIATLRDQLRALGGEPSAELQRELTRLTALLDRVERRIDNPFVTLDETRFGVGVADRSPALETGRIDVATYDAVIDSLTATCRTCHLVERATIRRVRTDQRTLTRAEFDHRAHVVHARCLDCHSAIPIRDAILTGEDPPSELDHSGIQNLPTIATCRQCHAPGRAAARCTTCHLFHPDKVHWSRLTR